VRRRAPCFGAFGDAVMKGKILGKICSFVFYDNGLGHACHSGAEILPRGLTGVFSSPAAEVSGKHGPQVIKFQRVLDRQFAHKHALIGDCCDQPVPLQRPRGLPDRATAYPHLRREAVLIEALARRHFTTQDDAFQLVAYLKNEGLLPPHAEVFWSNFIVFH